MAPLVALQVEHNLVARNTENEFLPMAKALDLGITAWSPLAGGILARSVSDAGASRRQPGRTLNGVEAAVVAVVEQVAAELGVGMAEVALAALLHDVRYGAIIPIVGATQVEHVDAALAALEIRLNAGQMDRLYAAGKPDLSFPHKLLRGRFGELLTTGGASGKLRNHRHQRC
jgi:aryl-alcohol dehydrogenase-like predicted oxidoreductase